MVAGVDLVCRSKIPVVPDLDADISSGLAFVDLDYDFIRERQVIADWCQYCEQKTLHERHTPTSLCGNLNQFSSSRICSTPPPVTSAEFVQVSNLTEDRAEGKDEHASAKPTVLHSTDETTSNLPVSARQLICGQVLQPRRTEGPPSTTVNTVHEPPSPTVDLTIKPDHKQSERIHYLRDFDNGPDDPFASVELKTINELEELKNVLLIAGPSVHSSPPSTVTVRCSPSLLPDTNRASVPMRFQTSYSPSALPQRSFSSNLSKPISPSSPNKSPSLVKRPVRDGHLPYTAAEIGPIDRYDQMNGLIAPFRKALSISVPDLEVPRTLEPPTSVTKVSEHLDSHSPIMDKSTPQTTGRMNPLYSVANLRPMDPETSRIESLLRWAKRSGFSEGRTLQLLNSKQNRSRFFDVPVDEAIQTLTDQLKLVELLILEHSPPRFKGSLSEQSAIVAASVFLGDLTRARQFATAIMDLEQSGYSQDVTRAFFVDNNLGSNASIAHLLAVFSHPMVPYSPTPDSSSIQPLSTPRQLH